MNAIDVQTAVRRFSNYADDVLAANYRTFHQYLGIFMEFCENDPVVSVVTSQLKANNKVHFVKWLDDFERTGGSFVGSKHFVLPPDDEDRLALVYQFMLAVNSNNIELEGLMLDAFGTTNFDQMIYVFNEQFFSKFVRDLGYRLQPLIASLRTEHSVPPERLLVFNHYDRSVILSNISGGQVAVSMSGDARVLAPEIEDLADLLNEVLETARSNNDLAVDLIRRLEKIEEKLALHIAEFEEARGQILQMVEDMWLHKVGEDLKSRFQKIVESQLPALVRTLVLKGIGAAAAK
jgi:hypothetical protein